MDKRNETRREVLLDVRDEPITSIDELVEHCHRALSAQLSERVTINGVDVVLTPPDDHESEWIDFGYSLQRLEAAWLRLSPNEPPLNPRIVGEPGLGKTTLAVRCSPIAWSDRCICSSARWTRVRRTSSSRRS